MKNDTGWLLRVLAGVVMIAGLIWGLLSAVDQRSLLGLLVPLLLAGISSGALLGLSELIRLAAFQEEILLRMESQLKLLVPKEKSNQEMHHCAKCGTPLPPQGKVCPTCHYTNS